jgi:L-alanine-DL-glutamate epimerase-like enolase superfamily enzyme
MNTATNQKHTDVRVVAAELYLLPVQARMPLKFGTETVSGVTCARVRLTVQDRAGRRAVGWGETPLSVTWVWPSAMTYAARLDALCHCCRALTAAWASFEVYGHPIEVGHAFLSDRLHELAQQTTRALHLPEPLPHLAALVCCSAFDIALHDAYGVLHDVDIYRTYNRQFMSHDLSYYLTPDDNSDVRFQGLFPGDFLLDEPARSLPAWHLVGGVDPLTAADIATDPRDGYPVSLEQWIDADELRCLKIKLRGNDAAWDMHRTLNVGQIGAARGTHWLSTDFNCTVTDPHYVNEQLDRLRDDHPALYGMLLYVEQPFPYDLERHRIDVHSVSARKPLFMDESAHDWKLVALGRALGWTGVALKTCKTQTGALLSLCWAKAHGMTLMVQDLTNPMLAMAPHARLAAHAGTIMGVETNAPQFYPAASDLEARVHPGLYRRRHGRIDLSSLRGPGFGYRVGEIARTLPEPTAQAGK